MRKNVEQINKEIKALTWEQNIKEACDGDLQAGRLGNLYRECLTLETIAHAYEAAILLRGELQHVKSA